jgi:hypothetical protein
VKISVVNGKVVVVQGTTTFPGLQTLPPLANKKSFEVIFGASVMLPPGVIDVYVSREEVVCRVGNTYHKVNIRFQRFFEGFFKGFL